VAHVHKPAQKPNGVLLFVFDVLAFASGAGVILAVLHWLADVLPIFQSLGLS